MSGVRDRLERETRPQPEPSAPKMTRTNMTSGNGATASTRERAERVVVEEKERLTPPERRGVVNTAVHPQHVGSVRERIERQQSFERDQVVEHTQTEFERGPRPSWERGLPADWEYQQEQERLRLNAEDDARKARERQGDIARRKQEQETANQNLVVNLALNNATPAERTRVLALVPADQRTYEKLWRVLMELREIGPRPEWAQRF